MTATYSLLTRARAAVAAAHCVHYLSVAETAAPHLTGRDQGRSLVRLAAGNAAPQPPTTTAAPLTRRWRSTTTG
jgi:hypothetical protein